MGRCGCACPCACFMLMIVDGCRGIGCDCSRCGHWPGYEADCWRLTFQVRYWMIGVGDVRLSMSVFDVGWMCTACCDLGRVVNGVGTESVSWLVDVVFR